MRLILGLDGHFLLLMTERLAELGLLLELAALILGLLLHKHLLLRVLVLVLVLVTVGHGGRCLMKRRGSWLVLLWEHKLIGLLLHLLLDLL